ncbi:RsiV family protein [Segniliparus rugosus]|uniref:DUF3298 domain-containing protein n=1 Tax=Segniliparus rugosus (strain ATCC BAA-974 / DSM 45345 / CCUG 50838 / CIP 108380 / JCM 13579 / CDC 945) TaxID=679197 RepID=E5XLM9_SEGRC|nr:RsiV family protein [Segniliparus rugosus]EFV14707.1 hypothetical protein HMPREF9336_00398 [Segniliparus rugosus ATCC BAA-974]
MGKRRAGWLAFALLAGLGLAPAEADPLGCSARAGSWDAAQSRCVVRVSASAYTESVQVPLDLDPPVQQAADDELAALRATFEHDAARATPDRPFSLSETYEQIPGPDGVTNIVMTVFAEVGAYHPVAGYRTLVFKGDRRIGLADLFPDVASALRAVSPIVQADLERKLLAGRPVEASDPLELNIVQGLGADPEHYQHFVLAPGEVRFLFLPYQVACYAAGPQTGHVPFGQIRDVLAPGLI